MERRALALVLVVNAVVMILIADRYRALDDAWWR